MSNIGQNSYKTLSGKPQMELTKNLFSFKQIDDSANIDSTLIFEEIRKEVENYLLGESEDTDSTDGVFHFLSTLSQKIQEEFDELLDGNTDKKRFLKALTKMFALLSNRKVDTPEKIKKILKIVVETTIKIWQGQN